MTTSYPSDIATGSYFSKNTSDFPNKNRLENQPVNLLGLVKAFAATEFLSDIYKKRGWETSLFKGLIRDFAAPVIFFVVYKLVHEKKIT